MLPRHPLPGALRRLTSSHLAAQSAEQISLAAAPLVAVYALGAGPGSVGLLVAAQTLPFLLAALPLGLLADRLPRPRLLIAAESLRMLTLLAMLAAWQASVLSLGLLALLGFLGALGTVAYTVATPGLVVSLAPRVALASANARIELARAVAFGVGPAVTGVLLAWAGATAVFSLAALLSASALALLLRVREPDRSPPKRHPLAEELRAGVRFVWHDGLLRPVFITAVVFNLAWFVLQAAYVPYAVARLGLSGSAVGITLAMAGAGMLAGATLAPHLLARLPFGPALLIGPLAALAAALLMAATLLWPSGWLAAAAFALLGAGPMVWTVATTTLRQHITPNALLGRVSAVFLTANAGARPIGATLGSVVGAQWGTPACLWLALAGFALQAGIILCSAPARLRQVPAAPLME